MGVFQTLKWGSVKTMNNKNKALVVERDDLHRSVKWGSVKTINNKNKALVVERDDLHGSVPNTQMGERKNNK
jgi:hypothetical protein